MYLVGIAAVITVIIMLRKNWLHLGLSVECIFALMYFILLTHLSEAFLFYRLWSVGKHMCSDGCFRFFIPEYKIVLSLPCTILDNSELHNEKEILQSIGDIYGM